MVVTILIVRFSEESVWITNASSFRVINSGITSRTPKIFSVFLFDYTLQFHTNGLLTTQFMP